MAEPDTSAGSDGPLLVVRTWDRTTEFWRVAGGVEAREIESGEQVSAARSFTTLTEAVVTLDALALDHDDTTEVDVSPSAGISFDEAVRLARQCSDEFEPTGGKRDVLGDPPLVVNGHRFFSVSFDDDGWELIQDANDYTMIASVHLFKSASRVSGGYFDCVGRLPTGAVVTVLSPDEDAGWVQAVRADLANVDAVIRWLNEAEGWVRPLFEAAYRDGRTIEVGSDLDPQWSGTLEISHRLNLDGREQKELWRRLES